MAAEIGSQESMSLKAIAGLMVPYGIFLAAVYLTAYWSPFGLMPFHYANVADLGAATLAGLATAFIGLAIGVIAGFVLGARTPQIPERHAQWVFWAVMITSIIISIALWVFWRSPTKWYVIGMLASFIFTPLVVAAPVVNRLSVNPIVRVLVVLALCYMPGFMYGRGAGEAAKVQSNDKGSHVIMNPNDAGALGGQQQKYAGMLGEYHVLYEPITQRTTLIPNGTQITIEPVKLVRPVKPDNSVPKN